VLEVVSPFAADPLADDARGTARFGAGAGLGTQRHR